MNEKELPVVASRVPVINTLFDSPRLVNLLDG
jgi:hypothetical protein